MASTNTKKEYLRLITEEGLTDLMPIFERMAGDEMSFWKWYRDVYQRKGWDAPKAVVRDCIRKELRKLKGQTTRGAAEKVSEKYGFDVSRQLVVRVRKEMKENYRRV
jgi:hypothetical protein